MDTSRNPDVVGWRYQREIGEAQLAYFENLADTLGAALDVGEGSQYGTGPNFWHITLFFDTAQGQHDLIAALALAEQMAGLEPLPVVLKPLLNEDWQAKSRASFPPLSEGPFFIYGFEARVPEGKIGLNIPAGMAFGSGEHATTALCLLAYERLHNAGMRFANVLDMGCGSGILAIAAAKRAQLDGATHFTALGVDVDAPSITVCRENILNNAVEEAVTAVHGDGFKAPGVDGRAPYDLVFANILMNPLLAMAQQLYAVVAPGGVAILSGFTAEQAARVEKAYTDLGLIPMALDSRGDWCALVLKKPA